MQQCTQVWKIKLVVFDVQQTGLQNFGNDSLDVVLRLYDDFTYHSPEVVCGNAVLWLFIGT